MALSKEISQQVILEDFIKACKLGFNHSQGHHYGYTKEELNHLIGEILFICGLDRSDYVEPAKATELLTSSSTVTTEEDGWIRVQDYNGELGRLLVFSPLYVETDPMRVRIIDAQFLSICKDVTHFKQVLPPKN